ncbi:MAG: PilZ domain-containing protein [Oceanospirillales bacterium]|uniref:PilZ domain-containing protein n=1 Tax=Marinobacterium halophilum TaxID=267374 RepID=A0A2P8EYL4_9GAMM|nr:PilZ domain-containing protein [Marinobacterium halophilum]MBR9828581.1 PilZ domain-containing protein [Oceanospirillales bacterium]PSL14552.1 PilZ domain-containing protein [Marinobacterium halophilum]
MKPIIRIPDITDSGRRAFRLKIGPDAPLRVRINGKPVKVDNISATGLAFTTETQLTLQYCAAVIKFKIAERIFTIECTLRLVRKSGHIWCADFSELNPQQQRLLSEFITGYQSEQIRNQDNKTE